MITPAQCRAARALVEWSQRRLADAANVSESTIRAFEKGRGNPTYANLHALQTALETAGVRFLKPRDGEGPGVRLKIYKCSRF